MQYINAIIAQNRKNIPIAIPSICSAHPDVLAACLMLAQKHDVKLLVESTSNQVNQHGGYTGMNPADFISFIYAICKKCKIDKDRVIFGGDHLGPQVWRSQSADFAMSEAIDLVKAYVKAGFTKIHLDCSEGCKGEDAQVGDDLAASRAAILAKACEEAAPDPRKIHYIVGTEVPPPGGARADETLTDIIATDPKHAQVTIIKHQQAFKALGIEHVWDKVIGLVVQPGLEFAPDHVFPFNKQQEDELSEVLTPYSQLCYEAHSTDYQDASVYQEIAKRHFAIHKVGPALTFAYRKAVYALSCLENWLTCIDIKSNLPQIMEDLMLKNPENWEKHYVGTPQQVNHLRHFGYADRIRYYWANETAVAATTKLMENLKCDKPLLPLIDQFFSPQTIELAKRLENEGIEWAQALVYAEIQAALLPYFVVYKPDSGQKLH